MEELDASRLASFFQISQNAQGLTNDTIEVKFSNKPPAQYDKEVPTFGSFVPREGDMLNNNM